MADRSKYHRPGPSAPGFGKHFRLSRLGVLLLLVASVAPMTSAVRAQASFDPYQTQLSTADWRKRLRENTDEFATARLRYRLALIEIERGEPDRARPLLEQAVTLDPRFDQPHRTLATIDLKAGELSAAGELYEAARDRVSGYRNQSISLANLLLTADAILGVLLVWCSLALTLRYLPYIHHRVAQKVLSDTHRKERAPLLWVAVILPVIGTASWGVVPWLALVVPVIWIHADRRPRALLALLLGLLAIQGAWERPFSAVLAGTNPSSLPSLVERAAYEPPSEMLREQIAVRRATDPQNADLPLAEGLLLARRGDFEASSKLFLENLERRPEDVTATNNLAANHFFRGDIDRAVAGFQKAAALDSARAVPYYNLSQAYIHKLYLKEGGQALQQAMRRGFALTGQVERLPHGAVYFLRPSLAEYWRMAWNEKTSMDPFEVLEGRAPWLGVPAHHVGNWLVSILVASGILGLIVPRKRLVFECVNCGSLACRHCRGEHEGAVLCTGCALTARRAKSEMVLTTLLRNRRRDAESDYQLRMRNLDAWLPGAGALSDGVRRRGILSALFMSVATIALWFGEAPLSDPWDSTPRGWFNLVRLAGLLLLAVVILINTWGRATVRGRHLQPHPSSAVSLAGLIEGRPPTRARASVGG